VVKGVLWVVYMHGKMLPPALWRAQWLASSDEEMGRVENSPIFFT